MSETSRRDFLQTSSASLGASLLCASLLRSHPANAAKKQEQRVSEIIDTHTHFYDPTRKEGVPWPGPQSSLYRKVMPAEFMEVAAPYGVTGTVVVEASPWIEDNAWLLSLAAENPCILGVVGSLPVGTAEFQPNLARFKKNPLYKGLRISTPLHRIKDQNAFLADMQAFAATGLIVDINGAASGFTEILKLKRAIPELRIVVEHLPRTPSKETEQNKIDRNALHELASLPDVYGKVSYVLKAGIPNVSLKLDDYRDELDATWKFFGADKVFYGSNWPASDPVCPYGTIVGIMKEYLAGKTQEEAEQYFYKNARVAYDLPAVSKKSN